MAESRREVEEALRKSFLFPLLGPDEQARFLAAAHSRSWTAGTPIVAMGEPGTSMMLVRVGNVRISRPSTEGRSIVLAELGPGAVFGEIALLDGGPRTADVGAVTNCTLLLFERRDFMPLLEHNWRLAEAVLRMVCERLRRADAYIADLAFSDLPARLAKTLVARSHRGPGGAVVVDDTQGALAAMIGGSREAVNRCLRKWEKAGLIAMNAGRIALSDPDGLAKLAGGGTGDR
ncbi:MAG: Crp/Fnr family transcriptional regulator [Amaricoccus sp.]